MVAPVMLTAEDVAKRVTSKYPPTSISAATWRRYVYADKAPQPDDYVGRTPVWRASTVDEWGKSRPGRGAGGGRPVKAQPEPVPA